MSKDPVDLLIHVHVQRTPLSNLDSWFLGSTVREGGRECQLSPWQVDLKAFSKTEGLSKDTAPPLR